MAADDVAKALMAMDDEDLRARVAGGDLAGLGDLDLSEDERTLVRAAAADDPEVAGYLLCDSHSGLVTCNSLTGQGGLAAASNYAKGGLSTSQLGNAFGGWLNVKQAQGGTW